MFVINKYDSIVLREYQLILTAHEVIWPLPDTKAEADATAVTVPLANFTTME